MSEHDDERETPECLHVPWLCGITSPKSEGANPDGRVSPFIRRHT